MRFEIRPVDRIHTGLCLMLPVKTGDHHSPLVENQPGKRTVLEIPVVFDEFDRPGQVSACRDGSALPGCGA